jgi:hypothetical protein
MWPRLATASQAARPPPPLAMRPRQVMFGGSGGDAGACGCDLPANDNAYRLSLAQGAVGGGWAWAAEKMPGGRNMCARVRPPRMVSRRRRGSVCCGCVACRSGPSRSAGAPGRPAMLPLRDRVDAVLLPNGKLLLVNGNRVRARAVGGRPSLRDLQSARGFSGGPGLPGRRGWRARGRELRSPLGLPVCPGPRFRRGISRKSSHDPLPSFSQFGVSNGGGPAGYSQARSPVYEVRSAAACQRPPLAPTPAPALACKTPTCTPGPRR